MACDVCPAALVLTHCCCCLPVLSCCCSEHWLAAAQLQPQSVTHETEVAHQDAAMRVCSTQALFIVQLLIVDVGLSCSSGRLVFEVVFLVRDRIYERVGQCH